VPAATGAAGTETAGIAKPTGATQAAGTIETMKNSVLERYLTREVLGAWLAVMSVLLAIMLGTRFASFLSMAAKGDLPRDLLVEVAGLSSLRFMVILMPVSLLLAIMLSLGRLYADSEIAAMTGCGVSLAQLYRPFVIIAVALAGLTGLLSFQIGPWAGREGDYLVNDARRLLQFTPFEPGKFKPLASGKAVFYTSGIDPSGARLGQVFAQLMERDGTSTIVAPQGHQSVDAGTGERIVTLENGYRYRGEPGAANFDVTHFGALTLRISPPPFTYVNSQRKLKPTSELLNGDTEDRAELQGRAAAPISVILLTLLAIPLSHLRPREGRYGKVVLGVVAYLLYANLLLFGQSLVAKGKVSALLGMWSVHALVLAIAVYLIGRRQGWWQSRA
jgi:lipopolysaccharide export system permease protein